MTDNPQKAGPYAPPENIGRILSKVRQSGVRKLDTEFLSQLGIHVAMAPRSIRTLEFLGFTDKDGNPEPLLQQYYAAGSDEDAQALLANSIKSSYAIIFRAANPEVEGREKVEQAFRLMEPAGQRTRMVTLFLGLCKLAGMEIKDPPSGRAARSVTPRSPKPKTDKNKTTDPTPPSPSPVPISVSHRHDQVLFHPSIDAFLRSIRGLIESDSWNAEARERVLKGFETQLDLFLPVKSDSSKGGANP